MAVGAGGARDRAARQQADPALGRLRGVSLVSRDGAPDVRGPGDRRRDERPVRQHQSRPRGAAGHRPDLHAGAAPDRRAGRLARDHVPDAGGRAGVGRHLFPERIRATAGRPLSTCCARCRGCSTKSRTRSSRTERRCWRGSPRRRGRRAGRPSASRSSTARPSRSATPSTPCTAASAAPPSSRSR